MKRLFLIGGGGHCRSCIDVIEAGGIFEVAGIIQSPSSGSEPVSGYPVIGTDEDLPTLFPHGGNAMVAVGQIKSATTRIRLYETLKSLGVSLPVIVSPRAQVSKRAQIEEASIVMHGAVVNSGATVARNCIINSQALVEHDAYIEDHCHVSTGALVNGGVIIRKGSFIGSGAILREGVEVGAGAVVGAGQVVMKDVPPAAFLHKP
jgi:sugar O-acyltransferase (sialic acid O-acetyltransferase NeuD family)